MKRKKQRQMNFRQKNNQKKLKNKKGITLIALVITIIVLLILAGVSIATLTGENGILTQANNSKVETRGAAVQEERDLWVADKEASKYSNGSAETLEQLINRLVEQNLLTEDEKDLILGNDEKGIEATGQVTIGSRTIVFGTSGTTLVDMFLAGKDCTEENCQNLEHLHIGDYVDYKPEVGKSIPSYESENGYGEQRYTVQGGTTWRVLGLDETTNELLITTGTPVKKDGSDPYFYMKGAESYVYCKKALDNVCTIFGTGEGASGARSIRIEDVNNALGVVKEGNIVYLKSDASKTTNIDVGGFLGKTFDYTNLDYTGYTPESFLQGKTAEEIGVNSIELDAYGYMETAVNASDRIKELIFAGTDTNKGEYSPYWLASPGVLVGSGCAHFGPGAVLGGYAISGYDYYFRSDGSEYDDNLAVRPVVSLKSGVTEEIVPKIPDQTEIPWE